MADLARSDQALQMAASLVAQLGVADVVVNAMGGSGPVHVEAGEQPLDWWDAMQARLLPAMQALQALLPGMRSRGCGVVVNLAAALAPGAAARAIDRGATGLAAVGTLPVGPGRVMPGPEASAADALAQAGAALASRVAADGLRINTVLTPVLTGSPDEAAARRVADCVLFLAGPGAAAVNGATIAAGA
ncbi:MAG: Enoyl-(Acyl carrier protein) reductase [Pseudomonadota bacterium]|jgi:NAD(P)-dependent dehydrogenase (short-subunit alcohol dehydrogenase family)